MQDQHPHQDKIKLLNETHNWPCLYTFKFVLPKGQQEVLLATLGSCEIATQRLSRTGKFVSLTITKTCSSAEEVLYQYQSVRHLTEIICL